MASGEKLKKLFRSYRSQDSEAFYASALEIIADEKRKNHNVLANDLVKILNNGVVSSKDRNVSLQGLDRLPKDREGGTLLVEVKSEKKYFSDLVISKQIEDQLQEVLEEVNSSEILRTYGMSPKQNLLFAGPPGCGKTLTAEVIANELGLPMLYTRFDAVISSYLGETASNLRKVFDYASNGAWVVFFDEFDAIGKSRENGGEHGELKRVVNTFLQLLDNYKSNSLFIAATNHEGLLDKALWRRFDEIIYFDKPDKDQIIKLIEVKLRGFHHKDLHIDKFIQRMAGWSHADIERACFDAVKLALLDGKDRLVDKYFSKAFKRQKNRLQIIQDNSKL